MQRYEPLTSHASSKPTQARLRRVVAEHSGALKRFLSSVGVPPDDLDDALQETFLVLFAKIDQVAPQAERHYLVATAVRVASNLRRGNRRRGDAYARYLRDVDDCSTEPTVEREEDCLRACARAGAALNALPTELRDILLMCELDDYSVVEAAEQLGIPVGTAASRLRRARKSLEELLCGAVEKAADESPGSTRIFHWWATEEERSALEAMLDVHRRSNPRAPIVGTPLAGVSTAKRHLNTRILWNQPPDTFQASVGRDLLDWVRLNRRDDARGRLKPLDDLCAREAWAGAFPDVLLDAVSFGGHVYAVPINIHRTNTLFFRRRLFTENGLAVPRSLSEFMSVAEELRRSGVVPLTLGVREGWPLTLLAFENLMVALAGADYYVDFFTGQKSASDPVLRETLETLKKVLTYVNDDAASLTWNQAVDRMLDGQSAMTVMGDWTRGYLAARGASVSSEPWSSDCLDEEEMGQMPAFGMDDVFVFSSDSFPLAAEGHKNDTLDLLRTFGSIEGQIAFNLRKGSIPARIDTDVSQFDPVARRTMFDFRTRRHVPTLTSIAPREFMSMLDPAMARFATNRDVDEVTRVIRSHYATLRS